MWMKQLMSTAHIPHTSEPDERVSTVETNLLKGCLCLHLKHWSMPVCCECRHHGADRLHSVARTLIWGSFTHEMTNLTELCVFGTLSLFQTVCDVITCFFNNYFHVLSSDLFSQLYSVTEQNSTLVQTETSATTRWVSMKFCSRLWLLNNEFQ